MEIDTSCESAIRVFAARDFRNWTGLPDACTLEQVTQHAPLLNEGVGLARLGRTKRQFRMLTVPDYDQAVRVWLDGPKVLMLDVQTPKFPSDVAVVLNELGEPEAKLDYVWGTLPVAAGELVYAKRGLTLFAAPTGLTIFHLAAFSPTTVDRYVENYRLHLGKKPFPPVRKS